MENIPPLMTINELQRFIGRERVGREALYQFARKYGFRLGNKLFIPRRAVLALIEGRLDELENPAGAGGAR